ncbi:MAG: TrmB family transcriptional regulator [Thermoplasmatota archaeon]
MDRFTQVGLARDEAACYLQLLRAGPARAADVALALGFSRPRTYRALDSLAHHGFAHLGVGRPRLYAAAPSSTVFHALRSRAETLAASVQAAEEELAPRLQRLDAPRDELAVRFTTIRGMAGLVNQSHNLYAEAQSTIDLFFTHPGDRELFRTVDDTSLLARRARQGMPVRLMVRSDPQAAAALALSRSLPNVDIRVVDTDVLSTFALADRREVLVFVTASRTGIDPDLALGFRTDAAEYVAMQSLLFERLWQTGELLVEESRKPGRARRASPKGNA